MKNKRIEFLQKAFTNIQRKSAPSSAASNVMDVDTDFNSEESDKKRTDLDHSKKRKFAKLSVSANTKTSSPRISLSTSERPVRAKKLYSEANMLHLSSSSSGEESDDDALPDIDVDKDESVLDFGDDQNVNISKKALNLSCSKKIKFNDSIALAAKQNAKENDSDACTSKSSKSPMKKTVRGIASLLDRESEAEESDGEEKTPILKKSTATTSASANKANISTASASGNAKNKENAKDLSKSSAIIDLSSIDESGWRNTLFLYQYMIFGLRAFDETKQKKKSLFRQSTG